MNNSRCIINGLGEIICKNGRFYIKGSDGVNTYNADDMAKDLGAIGYEVICSISKILCLI